MPVLPAIQNAVERLSAHVLSADADTGPSMPPAEATTATSANRAANGRSARTLVCRAVVMPSVRALCRPIVTDLHVVPMQTQNGCVQYSSGSRLASASAPLWNTAPRGFAPVRLRLVAAEAAGVRQACSPPTRLRALLVPSRPNGTGRGSRFCLRRLNRSRRSEDVYNSAARPAGLADRAAQTSMLGSIQAVFSWTCMRYRRTPQLTTLHALGEQVGGGLVAGLLGRAEHRRIDATPHCLVAAALAMLGIQGPCPGIQGRSED